MKTRKGIYKNLNESDYIIELHDYKFYFSSLFYKDKFNSEISEFIINETSRLKKKYNITVDMNLMLYLSLYLKIEKRGFRVYYKNKVLNKQEMKLWVQLF